MGILELISHYDPILDEHLKKVKASQKENDRLQVHYFSPDSQNEFISCCAKIITDAILLQRESFKYYSIIADATHDSAHIEQTVLTLRYVFWSNDVKRFIVEEKFLEFMNRNQKKGDEIAALIVGLRNKR